MIDSTQVLPDIDEALDFQVPCADPDCENDANWLGKVPRCPHDPFLCDAHQKVASVLAMMHKKVECGACDEPFCVCEVRWVHL